MNKKAKVKLLVSLAIVLSLAGLVFLSTRSTTYQILELKALDLRFVLKGERVSDAPVVHIDIDDQSLAILGRWPWPRDYHAKVTRILKECGARQIVMDVLFTEEFKDAPQQDAAFAQALADTGITYLPFYFLEPPSALTPQIRELLLKDITISPEAAAKALGMDPFILRERLPQARKALLNEAVREVLRTDPDIGLDSLFGKIEETRGWFFFPEDENYVSAHFPAEQAARAFSTRFAMDPGPGGWPFREDPRPRSVPIMAFVRTIRGGGFINAPSDIDGVTRSIPLFLKHEDRIYPQLTMAALLDVLDVKNVSALPGRVIIKDALVRGERKDIRIPVDEKGSMLLNWAGRWGVSFKHLSYHAILRLQEIREELQHGAGVSAGDLVYLKKTEAELVEKLTGMVKGKTCLIGLTATGTNDLSPVPLQEKYPMVGAHANLVDTIMGENFIHKAGAGILFAVFLLTALVIASSSLMKLWKSFFLVLGYAAVYFGAAMVLFTRFGLWIDLVGPFAIVVFGFLGITSYRFFTEEKEKLWIKQAFSHYLSDEVIKELMEDPDRLKLGGERRLLTVLFSDVRGFTAFSESRQPEEVVGMLNEILGEQVEVVFKHGGTLDKFVGDELMAFFGAPGTRHLKDHALVAVRVAVEIQERMRLLQDQRVRDNKHPLQIGIGINTGEMVVGNMGSSARMDYTVIGDNVNLGARLCSAASKDEIIISERTYALVAEHVHAEKLEPISVKGKAMPISIYRVTGLKQV